MTRRLCVSALAVCALTFTGVALAQRGSSEWMTTANDAQRSSWVRNDGKISLATMSKPGFDLLWKMKLDNSARQLNTILPPALLDFYIGYRGFRALGFFAASADRVIAVDVELGRLEWENKYGTAKAAVGTLGCPGGMTTAVARPTGTDYPLVPTGRGSGRGSPAKSAVGEPHEGAAILKLIAAREARAAAQPPPPPKPAAPAKPELAPAPSPFAPNVQYALALSSDGKLHSMYVSNGDEPKAAVPFVPPNAQARGLIAYDKTAYVTTTGNCGGVDNGVWALDLNTHAVSHWKTSKDVAGTAGAAAGPDGTVYVAAGDELVALEHRKLEPLAIHKADSDFSSSPVVFEFKGKDLIAIASKDGRLQLLDTEALHRERSLDRTEPFSTPGFEAGSLASWQDPAGTRWVLVATDTSVVAWKVVEQDGMPRWQKAWTSRELTNPLPPIVVNGVIFALSSGEFRSNDAKLTAAQRAKRSSNAVLYAMDALTGKELWNSGTIITSFAHSGGLAAGGSRVYVATYEGIEYAFGFPIEH